MFTDPQGTQKTVPVLGENDLEGSAFSGVEKAYLLRQCSDTRDKGLHGIEGLVKVIPSCRKTNFIATERFRWGRRRHFEHAELFDVSLAW